MSAMWAGRLREQATMFRLLFRLEEYADPTITLLEGRSENEAPGDAQSLVIWQVFIETRTAGSPGHSKPIGKTRFPKLRAGLLEYARPYNTHQRRRRDQSI